MSYPLEVNTSRFATPGDFQAAPADGVVRVPEEVSRVAQRLSLRDAGELMSYLNAFPSAFAHEMGWSADEVEEARDRLGRQLQGLLPEAELSRPQVVQRTYGAFPPGWRNAAQD